jgi:hypothetical protein
MGGSPGSTIAVFFTLALLPFGLWTWSMVRAERRLRAGRPTEVT